MTRRECECLLVAGLFKRVKTQDDFRECIVPGDRVVAAVAAVTGTLERLGNPVGVVRDLDGCLPARTEPALVDRVRRAAFEFLGREDPEDSGLPVAHDICVGVHHTDGQTASGRA